MEKAEANIAVSLSSAKAHACEVKLIVRSFRSQLDEEQIKQEIREAKEQLALTKAALRRRKGQGTQ